MAAPLICVLGDLVEDVVVRPEGPIRHGSDVTASIVRRQGGSAANVARAIAAQGGRCRFACRVGSDPLGDRLVGELSSAGVEVSAERSGRTGCIVVLVDDTGERTMIHDRGSSGEVGLPSTGWLDRADAVHLTLYTFEEAAGRATALSLARRARAQGIRLSLSLSSLAVLESMGRSTVEALVGEARPDVVMANEDEARWWGVTCTPPPQPVSVVVTRGGRPARLWQGRRYVDLDAPSGIDPIDTTGAGDAFAAGFLLSWAGGADLVESVRAGHGAAAHHLVDQGRRPHRGDPSDPPANVSS